LFAAARCRRELFGATQLGADEVIGEAARVTLRSGMAVAIPFEARPRLGVIQCHAEAARHPRRRDGGHGGHGRALTARRPRELEVLALLAEGASNKMMARLCISVHTAKFYVASLLDKPMRLGGPMQ
jgi:DNA-binding NarL/FixJ family response regulator